MLELLQLSLWCQYVTTELSKTALIPAAGMGTRLGQGPKALLCLGERSLLQILMETLSPLVNEIVVAAPPGFEAEFKSILKDKARVVRGGRTRQDSISQMLDACAGEILLIQDVSRPFASRALCSKVLEAAVLHGAAGAFVEPSVPIGLLEAGLVATYWDRHMARVFQAPQAFARDVLIKAQRRISGTQLQSTAQLVMQAGTAMWAITGEYENIKITTPLDWQIANKVIAPKLGLVDTR